MKPRWKVLVELLVGLFMAFGWSTLIWLNHEHDEQPFALFWWLAALLIAWSGLSLIRDAWREL
jgi:hypothetical protein